MSVPPKDEERLLALFGHQEFEDEREDLLLVEGLRRGQLAADLHRQPRRCRQGGERGLRVGRVGAKTNERDIGQLAGDAGHVCYLASSACSTLGLFSA